ncbi:MAG: cytochrome c3 family protein [Syntrophales bacterium]
MDNYKHSRRKAMERIVLFLSALFAFFVLLYATGEKAVDAAKPAKTSHSCKACHADLNKVLPKGHQSVSGDDISICAPCHAPEFSGKAEANAYSAGLHRAHEKPQTKLDCLVCHNWTPGKSFTVYNQKTSMGAPSKEDMQLMEKVFLSWAESPYLDSIHAKKNVDCMGCHGKSLPREGDTVNNDRCLACHGPLDKLEAKTAPKDFPDRNPHKSHLGDVACTVCHHAHSVSKTYCLECHKTFEMKIPGG